MSNSKPILRDERAQIGHQPSIATSIGLVFGLIAVLMAYNGEPLLALAAFGVAVIGVSIAPLFGSSASEVENEQ